MVGIDEREVPCGSAGVAAASGPSSAGAPSAIVVVLSSAAGTRGDRGCAPMRSHTPNLLVAIVGVRHSPAVQVL